MVTTIDPTWTDVPVTPLRGTLLDVASISEGDEWPLTIGLVDSYNCLDMAVPTELCPTPTEPKEFEGPNWLNGFRFAVYGGISCKPFGFDEQRAKDNIERVFRLKESVGVERALMQTRFGADGPDLDPGAGVNLAWEAATDITPTGGAVSPKVGFGLLEEYAASVYAGAPTLHLPRSVASLTVDTQWELVNGKGVSKLGSNVAAGGGYALPNTGPDGLDAPDNERWIYVSGQVLIQRGDLILPPPVTDYQTNDIYALAERTYIVAVDCFAAAIRVSVEDVIDGGTP